MSKGEWEQPKDVPMLDIDDEGDYDSFIAELYDNYLAESPAYFSIEQEYEL